MTIYLAPHNDDEGLFGSYIIQRLKPLVIVVTDGEIHEERYGKERGIEARREESRRACAIMGVDLVFLGISDKYVDEEKIKHSLGEYKLNPEINRVFAPSMQGGHAHHDLVCKVATDLWQDKCLYYSTYKFQQFELYGEMEIRPEGNEAAVKNAVLDCYTSQHGINAPHFAAVRNKSEYLNFFP